MFDRVLSAIIDALLAVPPISFVMGLVDSRWRPLWAGLWISVIIYVLSRAMNQLALARARLRIVSEPVSGLALAVQHPQGDSPRPDGPDGTASGRSASRDPGGSPSEKPTGRESGGIPVHIVIAALVVGAIAVVNVALFMRRPPNDSSAMPAASSTTAATDSNAPAPIDMRMNSRRMDDRGNCIGTFEVTQGPGTTARLLAFALDSSGAIIARDSAQVTSAVTGMFVDLTFRQVACDKIYDWQIQATTPTAR